MGNSIADLNRWKKVDKVEYQRRLEINLEKAYLKFREMFLESFSSKTYEFTFCLEEGGIVEFTGIPFDELPLNGDKMIDRLSVDYPDMFENMITERLTETTVLFEKYQIHKFSYTPIIKNKYA